MTELTVITSEMCDHLLRLKIFFGDTEKREQEWGGGVALLLLILDLERLRSEVATVPPYRDEK